MTFQSTPKSKADGAPPRTRRLTANEATFKSTRSRESSTERILDDKTSTRNRSRSYEPKPQRDVHVKQLIVDDDVELTLDDLETSKINVEDTDINHASHHEHEQAFRDLSLSFR